MHDRIAYQGITFDDVLLEPGLQRRRARDVDVRTRLTRHIRLNIPILSSPMDTVTESELAIALAQEGGIGHHPQEPVHRPQTREVDKVKRSENGIITDPITLPPDDRRRGPQDHGGAPHLGVPITVDGILKGILTRRDLKFLDDNDPEDRAEVMTKENLVTPGEHHPGGGRADPDENKVEKLLLVDDQFRLKGLITIKDIDKMHRFPNACKDARGRLRVGAASGSTTTSGPPR
jgi:IMP dehydrogenase